MSSYPEKITRVLYTYNKLNVKLHVKILSDKNEPLHVEYEYGKKKYVKLDNFAYLTIDMMEPGEWNQSKSIMVTQYNIHIIISAINKVIDSIYKSDIYATKSNGNIVFYKDNAVKARQQINVVAPNGAILIEPTVVYDDNDIGYEGVNLFINKPENMVQLPIHYLEALKYTLEKIDLFHYSQMLLNYFVTYYGKSDSYLFEKRKNIEKYKQHISFDSPTEETSANFRRNTSDSDYFGFNTDTHIV